MDIVKNTLLELEKLGVSGTLSNVVVVKRPGPWTMSYVTYDDGTVGCGCANNETHAPAIPESLKEFIGRAAHEVAHELYDMRDDVFMNSLRVSIASALSYRLMDNGLLRDTWSVTVSEDRISPPDLFQCVRDRDVVAVVGFASWWIPYLSRKARTVYISELIDPEEFRVIDLNPAESNVKVFHASKGKEVLGRADVVYITGQTVSNGTIHEVLEYSGNARTKIMFGPTSSFYPQALFERGVNLSYAMLFPNTPQFKQEFVLSNGYWYQSKAKIKRLLINKESCINISCTWEKEEKK